MKQFSYVLTNDHAQQTRTMGCLSREAARFSSRISLIHETKSAQICELKDVLALDMKSGNMVTVKVDGPDEEDAVAAMQNYFVANM
ncbi:MAG: HPr family phosphocarrier protein [Clostridia bacterium]|nr:HPr family phosphocarrier protein [Clostridia bacterium]